MIERDVDEPGLLEAMPHIAARDQPRVMLLILMAPASRAGLDRVLRATNDSKAQAEYPLAGLRRL